MPTKYKQTVTAKKSLDLVPEIIRLLEAGEVIILPTDNTYAFVAHAFNPEAVTKLRSLKEWDMPSPLGIFSTKEKAEEVAVVTPASKRMMAEFPYPVTMIMRKQKHIIDELTGGFNNLLILCPDRFIYDLVEAVPFPMACASASVSSEIIKVTTFEVAASVYDGKVPLIVDGGRSKYGRSGTLVDFTVEVPTILKYGPISVDDLRPILPEIILPSHLMK
ncbi:L-threonylcarbamoyladenylate synthase [Oscillatoria salina]|uniref:L-threonylcarbamoyladenylate synthase n=1 Tax=Oscillatoria salina TaxID=331517 RepID=UPI0013BAD330|nr:L-threonylcarbamoyladenylate synthase [Oscillatoria salina]MBZ8181907.1 L-threonylcarbamoyladenylate synthase [Oscillatoria salina IIICB1]NET90666.1 L-threonylcarbamoyladenylate synthase [Kamptonema sp. SIO1D9]